MRASGDFTCPGEQRPLLILTATTRQTPQPQLHPATAIPTTTHAKCPSCRSQRSCAAKFMASSWSPMSRPSPSIKAYTFLVAKSRQRSTTRHRRRSMRTSRAWASAIRASRQVPTFATKVRQALTNYQLTALTTILDLHVQAVSDSSVIQNMAQTFLYGVNSEVFALHVASLTIHLDIAEPRYLATNYNRLFIYLSGQNSLRVQTSHRIRWKSWTRSWKQAAFSFLSPAPSYRRRG